MRNRAWKISVVVALAIWKIAEQCSVLNWVIEKLHLARAAEHLPVAALKSELLQWIFIGGAVLWIVIDWGWTKLQQPRRPAHGDDTWSTSVVGDHDTVARVSERAWPRFWRRKFITLTARELRSEHVAAKNGYQQEAVISKYRDRWMRAVIVVGEYNLRETEVVVRPGMRGEQCSLYFQRRRWEKELAVIPLGRVVRSIGKIWHIDNHMVFLQDCRIVDVTPPSSPSAS